MNIAKNGERNTAPHGCNVPKSGAKASGSQTLGRFLAHITAEFHGEIEAQQRSNEVYAGETLQHSVAKLAGDGQALRISVRAFRAPHSLADVFRNHDPWNFVVQKFGIAGIH